MVGLPLVTTVLLLVVPRRFATVIALGAAGPTSAFALALGVVVLRRPAQPSVGDRLVADAAGALLVLVIGVVGLASVLVSPSYLASSTAQKA
jgi:formate hydrogenlyase subunit 3/multisubunit Na+/H+ antiporter MnhD subunit